jgi:AraC family transcriptional regulator
MVTARYWEQRAAGALHHAKYKALPGVRHRRIKGLGAERMRSHFVVAIAMGSALRAMGSLYGDLLSMCLSIALIKKYARISSVLVHLRGGLSRPRLKQVRDYIDENLYRDLRLKDLAALTGLSIFHLSRSFRESSGVTPHQYIVQRRVDRAKSLLLKPEWTIEQVASASGFSGGSQFSRVFRQTTGATPRTWRRTT